MSTEDDRLACPTEAALIDAALASERDWVAAVKTITALLAAKDERVRELEGLLGIAKQWIADACHSGQDGFPATHRFLAELTAALSPAAEQKENERE